MKFKYILYVIALFTFTSCEDVIDVDLDQGEVLLVTDAFITNQSEVQTIRLTKTAPYFDNQSTPIIQGAVVTVFGSDSSVYNFVDQNDGNYIWTPTANQAINSIGVEYTLEIIYQNETYYSISVLNPVPPVDSIKFEFQKASIGQDKDGYQAEFFAKDIAGREDFYWIKAFRNNKKVGNASSFNITVNGSFDGTGSDSLLFIFPVRVFFIADEELYQKDDSLRVEIWSINADVAEFFTAVETQTNNGGLFAVPASNVYGNIYDVNGKPQKKMLGAFSISAISSKTEVVQ